MRSLNIFTNACIYYFIGCEKSWICRWWLPIFHHNCYDLYIHSIILFGKIEHIPTSQLFRILTVILFSLAVGLHDSTEVGGLVGHMLQVGLQELFEDCDGSLDWELLQGIQGTLVQVLQHHPVTATQASLPSLGHTGFSTTACGGREYTALGCCDRSLVLKCSDQWPNLAKNAIISVSEGELVSTLELCYTVL